MRRWLWLVMLLVVPVWAQNFPQEVRVRPPGLCAGCDCPADNCFTAACDCTLPVTQAWANGMLERTVTLLQRAFPNHMADRPAFQLRVVTQQELGYTGFEQNFGMFGNGVLRISQDLSRRQAAATLAHEYAHAWHFAHHPDVEKMSEGLVEGFAEWIAYQVLKRMGDFTGADTIRNNADPLYGVGFRWFDAVEREKGSAAVWDIALNWLDLVGTRVGSTPAPSRSPVLVSGSTPLPVPSPSPSVAPSVAPAPQVIKPTRTGGYWVTNPTPQGEPSP